MGRKRQGGAGKPRDGCWKPPIIPRGDIDGGERWGESGKPRDGCITRGPATKQPTISRGPY
jgi:hypothetical protein